MRLFTDLTGISEGSSHITGCRFLIEYPVPVFLIMNYNHYMILVALISFLLGVAIGALSYWVMHRAQIARKVRNSWVEVVIHCLIEQMRREAEKKSTDKI